LLKARCQNTVASRGAAVDGSLDGDIEILVLGSSQTAAYGSQRATELRSGRERVGGCRDLGCSCMIRKVTIMVLLVASLTTSAAWVAGCFEPQAIELDLTDHLWGHVVSMGGSCRLIVSDFSGVVSSLVLPKDERHRNVAIQTNIAAVKDMYGKLCELPRRGLSDTTLGFGQRTLSGRGSPPFWYVRFPLWAPLLLFSTYPAIALIRGPFRRWRRRRRGLCIRCAYNLHGNVSGVCPECGTNTSLTNG